MVRMFQGVYVGGLFKTCTVYSNSANAVKHQLTSINRIGMPALELRENGCLAAISLRVGSMKTASKTVNGLQDYSTNGCDFSPGDLVHLVDSIMDIDIVRMHTYVAQQSGTILSPACMPFQCVCFCV
jgi:hypothetical protein